MKRKSAFLMPTLAILFMASLTAAEDQSDPETASDKPDSVESVEIDGIEPDAASMELNPEGGTLRTRDIGDAFKNFKPSEEISADNAVTFPVDI